MPLSWRQLTSLLGPPGAIPPQTIWLAAPQANEKRIVLRAPHSLSITRVDAVLSSGSSPSVSFHLRHGADVSAHGTAVTSTVMTVSSASTGTAFSSFANAVVPAEDWLWLEITAVAGSPAGLTVSVLLS
jgi:hypothetical protein